MVIFRSKFNSLRVSFPADTFGLGEGPDGKEAPFMPVKFVNGEFRTSKETIINRMKEHTGNEANYGTDFWMVPEEHSKNTMMALGQTGVTTDDLKLSEEDKELLSSLDTIKGPMGAKLKKYRSMLIDLISRFGIIGIKEPDEDITEKRLRARIIETLGVMEDENIWPIKESDDG